MKAISFRGDNISDTSFDGDKAHLRKRLLTLALPVILENLLQVAFHFADMIFVGKLSPISLAGVGLAQQFLFLVIAMLISFNTGIIVLISQNIGAKKIEVAQKAIWQALYVGVIFATFLSTVGFLFAYKIPELYQVSDLLKKSTGDYLFYILSPSLVLVWLFALSASFRGSGDTRTPLYVAVVTNLLNIFLDYVLIFGVFGFPRLEVAGAAIATSIARGVGCILLLTIFMNKKRKFYLPFKLPKPDFSIIKRIFSIALPTAIERFAFSSGGLIYASLVLAVGEKTFAAHRIALNVESLSFNPGLGFAIATTALIGQIVGSGDFKKAKRAAFESLKIAAMVMGLVGVILFILPDIFIRLFTKDLEVINQARKAVRIIALAQPLLATLFVLEGSLRGGGDTKTPMFITSMGMWFVRLPLTYVFTTFFRLGIVGAWLAMTADITAKALLVFLSFTKRNTFKRHVVDEAVEDKPILEE